MNAQSSKMFMIDVDDDKIHINVNSTNPSDEELIKATEAVKHLKIIYPDLQSVDIKRKIH